jgi:outer membrane protein OmpA-like peptidoglycan-associated protein
MFRKIAGAAFVLLLALVGAAETDAQKDVEGSQDHPLLTRMPGYYLSGYDVKDFDSSENAYVSGPEGRWEGKRTQLDYAVKEGAKQVSMTQIARNYENALRKIGAQIAFTDGRTTVAKLKKGNGITWVQAQAFNDGRDYQLLIVEPKPMEQAVTADAAALQQGIAAAGKVAVYGIYFDTGQATIKSESAPTLGEIVKMLTQSPRLQIYVVGHTDGTGPLETNLKLSADRAASVVKALVERGIEASRLRPAGVGPYCPEATNRTEEGRAKNRRVELVERSS